VQNLREVCTRSVREESKNTVQSAYACLSPTQPGAQDLAGSFSPKRGSGNRI